MYSTFWRPARHAALGDVGPLAAHAARLGDLSHGQGAERGEFGGEERAIVAGGFLAPHGECAVQDRAVALVGGLVERIEEWRRRPRHQAVVAVTHVIAPIGSMELLRRWPGFPPGHYP